MIKIFQVLVYYFTTPLSTIPFSGVVPEAYLESGQTSTMEFFCGNTEQLSGANYFLLDWVENRLLAKGLKY